MATGVIKSITEYSNTETLKDDTYGRVWYITKPELGILWVGFGGNSSSPSSQHDITGTLPSGIVPVNEASVATRKSGFITVGTDRSVQVRIMSGQNYDMGVICIPYHS